MNLKNMSPVTLRIVLVSVLGLLLIASVVVFTFGYKQLKTFGVSAQTTAAEADASQKSLQDLIQTKKILERNTEVVNRASQLISESKSYVYQDQIISDINEYGKESGIEISNISFIDTKTTPTAPAGSSAPSESTSSSLPGVKSMTASISIKNPTDYKAMLTFLHRIEQSLFRMQISQVGLSSSNDAKNPNQITSDNLTIEVYVR